MENANLLLSLRKFPPLNLFTDVQLQRVYLICLPFDILWTSFRFKKRGEREKSEKKKVPENFFLKVCAKIKNLNLSVIKHRLGMLEKFSLIFRSGVASQQYFTCNRESLDSDTSKIF